MEAAKMKRRQGSQSESRGRDDKGLIHKKTLATRLATTLPISRNSYRSGFLLFYCTLA
jgi:hypothetical protein